MLCAATIISAKDISLAVSETVSVLSLLVLATQNKSSNFILECKNIKQTCSGVGFYNSPTIQSQMQRKFYPLNVLGHGYSKNYRLIRNTFNVAQTQLGKAEAQLNYSEQWYTDFVTDCARLANQFKDLR